MNPEHVGREHYWSGRARTQNPYALPGVSRTAWFRGYDAARAANMAEAPSDLIAA